MSRLARINQIKSQVKQSSVKSSERANKVSFALLVSGPFLGGLPWILNYFMYNARYDAPKAIKYAKFSGKLVLMCYLTLILAFFMGRGEGWLDVLDRYVEPTTVVEEGLQKREEV